MLSIKKIIILNIVAFATLVGIAKWQSGLQPVNKSNECCVQTSTNLPKGNDFSIVNILSLKFGI